MAKYMSFDFSDGECTHYPIMVRIEQDISLEIMKEIDKAIKDKFSEYVEKDLYWKSDEEFVKTVLDELTKKYNFNYEVIRFDYMVDFLEYC